jgi:hypothetical protein
MNTETKYKLTALVFFFLLFAAFFLQFVHPYFLVASREKLEDNVYILPLAVLAGLVFAFQVKFYIQVRTKFKILPLIGTGLLLVLLIYVNLMNRVENLDVQTSSKIIELLNP